MTDMSRDSIVDRHCLPQRYVPYAVNSRPASQKIWSFLHGVYSHGNDFELIPAVKMETTSRRGSFGYEFPSIYNHCGFMASRNRKTLEKIQIFEVLSKNDPLRGIFQNSVLKGFIATPIDVWCSNFIKIWLPLRTWKWVQYWAKLKSSLEPNKNELKRFIKGTFYL